MSIGTGFALIIALLFYAAVIALIIWGIKYFIRYGIDYYFKKLDERSNQNK